MPVTPSAVDPPFLHVFPTVPAYLPHPTSFPALGTLESYFNRPLAYISPLPAASSHITRRLTLSSKTRRALYGRFQANSSNVLKNMRYDNASPTASIALDVSYDSDLLTRR